MTHQYTLIQSLKQLEEAKSWAAPDQAAELDYGCEVWPITYQGGQAGCMTRWPNGRGAIETGGDSDWGTWEDDILVLDSEGMVNKDGHPVMTLKEFIDNCRHPVLWFASQGNPTGSYEAIDDVLDCTPELKGWFDITGGVDLNGRWNWDGEGCPCDFGSNHVLSVTAFDDQLRYEELVRDIEES